MKNSRPCFLSAFHLALAAALLAISLASCSKPPSESGRAIKFYQSPMHPWITSDKPGNCTICGMALVPVYADDPSASPEPGSLLKLQDASLRVLGVATVPARRMELTRTLRFSGIFEDDDNLHRVIGAFYDGRIEEVYAHHVGVYVKQGQPLAAIYSPELLYVVREYQNAMRGGKPDIARTSAQRLVQYGLSREQVAALPSQPGTSFTIDLLAPIDGTVTSRKAYKGQYIKTGEPLFEMGDLSRLWFHAEVYERDLPGVKIGQKASIVSPTVPGREFEGIVSFVDPNFDPLTRSTKVRIEVNNPVVGTGDHGVRYLIPHRSYAEATIPADLGSALVIPRSALIRDGGRALVYVQKAPGKFEPRDVTVGRIGDEGVEITTGLVEGEPVVTQGNLLIDAEAQLRGAIPHPIATAATASIAPKGAKEFLAQLAKLSSALAADDAVASVQAARNLPELAAEIVPGDDPSARDAIHALQALSESPRGEDLHAIRKAFLSWSQAAAVLANALRKAGTDPGVRVFECPMTANSFPGAPAYARWVQPGETARNPYYGASMADCGNEVQP